VSGAEGAEFNRRASFRQAVGLPQPPLDESERLAARVHHALEIAQEVALSLQLGGRGQLGDGGKIGFEGGFDVPENPRGKPPLFGEQALRRVAVSVGTPVQGAGGPFGRTEFRPTARAAQGPGRPVSVSVRKSFRSMEKPSGYPRAESPAFRRWSFKAAIRPSVCSTSR
jgi:hypothetical protein